MQTPEHRAKLRTGMIVGSIAGLAVIAVAVILVAFAYGQRLATIRVHFVGPGKEAGDPKLPLVDKKERLPDYKLRVICETKGFWIFNKKQFECGPIPNRSAKEPIDFVFGGDVPRDKIQQINLVDDDPVKDDLVASVQATQSKLEENGYSFELMTERSLRFGFERIWRGNFGYAVIATILALVLTLILSAIESLFTLPGRMLDSFFHNE